MTGTEFYGYTRALGAPEGWEQDRAKCIPLFIRDEEIGGYPSMESVWVLSPEERFAIARGANISLLVVGKVHPPVALRVTDVKVLDETPFEKREEG